MTPILIVEDEVIVGLDLEHILTSQGYDVVGIASDTPTALDLASKCSLALVDINLCDGPTGPAIAMELARKHGVKIIFVTANPEQIGDAATVASGYVVKPFRASEIIEAVAAAEQDRNDEDGAAFG